MRRTPPPARKGQNDTPETSRILRSSTLASNAFPASTNANTSKETPGKKRKNDEIRSPQDQNASHLPKYYSVLLKKTDKKPLKDEGTTKIRRAIFSLVGGNFELSNRPSGEVEVHFTQEKMAEKLLQTASSINFSGSNLEAIKSPIKNYVQYVIYGVELDISIPELSEFLVYDQNKRLIGSNIPNPIRLKRKQVDGTLKDSKSILIKLEDEITDNVYLYGQKLHYKLFKPKPIQCSKCLIHGHTVKNCNNDSQSCLKCGSANHIVDACTEQNSFCKNCKIWGHSSLQKNVCPAHQRRAEILRLSTTENIPYSIVAASIPPVRQSRTTPNPRANKNDPGNLLENTPLQSGTKSNSVAGISALTVTQQNFPSLNHPVTRPTTNIQPREQDAFFTIKKSSDMLQNICTYLTMQFIIDSEKYSEEKKAILKRKAITNLFGSSTWKVATTELKNLYSEEIPCEAQCTPSDSNMPAIQLTDVRESRSQKTVSKNGAARRGSPPPVAMNT